MKSLKILIVEDELIIAADLQTDLEEAGHKVVGIARNVKEAMKFVKTTPPDISVIDIALGKIKDGGIQVAKAMLDHHWMPVIYLTANSDSRMAEQASTTFPAAYLFKPYRVAELLVQISLAHTNFSSSSVPVITGSVQSDSFYFPNKNGHDRVVSNEILYMKAQGSYTDLYLSKNSKPRVIGTNIGTIIKYFSSLNFVRLSKSLFVNLDHLHQIERNQIFLGEERSPVEITEANRRELLRKLKVIRTK